MTTTRTILAAATAAIATLTVNAQQPYYPGNGHSPWHHHRGSTIITPDGPVFVPPHNDGPHTIITPDGPIFVSPNGNGGSTIITPDGPIFVHPN